MKEFFTLFLIFIVMSCNRIDHFTVPVETPEGEAIFSCVTLNYVPVICGIILVKEEVIEVEAPIAPIVEEVLPEDTDTETIKEIADTVVEKVDGKEQTVEEIAETIVEAIEDTAEIEPEYTPTVKEVIEVVEEVIEKSQPVTNLPVVKPETPPIRVNPPVVEPVVVVAPPATDVEDLVNDHNENPSAKEKAVNSQGLHTHRLMHTHWISDKWGNLVEKKEHTHENLEHAHTLPEGNPDTRQGAFHPSLINTLHDREHVALHNEFVAEDLTE